MSNQLRIHGHPVNLLFCLIGLPVLILTSSFLVMRKVSILHQLSKSYSFSNSLTIRMSSSNAFQDSHNRVFKKRNQVIVITGATAVGKSTVARELFKFFDQQAEFISGDSVQIYRHFEIGSNKPSKEEQALIPHHLIDICDPEDPFTAADFVQKASNAIRDVLSRGKTPIVVGGSTMWIQWLVHGIPDNPKASEEVIHKAEEMLRPFVDSNQWDEAVAVVDKYRIPDKPLSMCRNDWYRLNRYLQVALAISNDDSLINETSKWYGDDIDLKCFFICEDRRSLYNQIDIRCLEMLNNGLMEEVSDLLESNRLHEETMSFRAIGYRQTVQYLCRPMYHSNDLQALREFLLDFASATRNYAKRQLTWYRKDSRFLWIEMFRPTVIKPKELSTNISLDKPYEHIAKQIISLCNGCDYDDMLNDQIQYNEIISKVRANKNYWMQQYESNSNLSTLEVKVMEAMMFYGEFGSKGFLSVTSKLSPLETLQNANLRHSLIMLRCSESKDKAKLLKEYTSLLDPRYLATQKAQGNEILNNDVYITTQQQLPALLQRADKIRQKLNELRPDLISKYSNPDLFKS